MTNRRGLLVEFYEMRLDRLAWLVRERTNSSLQN
jgi:hypothetical protein